MQMLMLSASFCPISRCLISEPCPSSIWIRSIIAMQLQLRATGSSYHSILLSSPPSIKSWLFFYYANMQFMLHPNEKEILLLSETCAHVIQAES
ncbi:hypothetical protein HZ326_15135 [Fusarium oxysporum f. sp. albedinis]|nr:hypothetical protein HZ326_15135 [Fusarium oxysporum f. sp. albedinis]